jgi:outer membrane protein OmpA-like peptidoglycan-associated protein/uncharacterized protein YegP (UPF0339 family)
MTHEDYLDCADYRGKDVHPNHSEFSAFFDEESQRHFFALLDADGDILLKSEGYPQSSARENGIQSVIKNRANRDFYSVKQGEDGVHFLSLRAANYREIARSCGVASEAEALALIPYVTGESLRSVKSVAPLAAAAAETEPQRVEDDYLVCSQYDNHPDVGADYEGLVKFSHSNGEHYFAWYDEDGNTLMRSEGYPTTAARDNGMASVAKNRDLEERFSIQANRSFFFAVLKAGNHQEIARSCPLDSEEKALAMFPSHRAEKARLKAEAIAAAAAAAVVVEVPAAAPVAASADRYEDDYLACTGYDGFDADENGMAKFTNANGKHYFVWYKNDGSVRMRSEGYPTTAARDNGYNSVLKNRDESGRYSVEEKLGRFFVVLKAGNHQEIARSCPYSTMVAASESYAPAAPAPVEAPIDIITAPVLLAAAAAPVVVAEVPAAPADKEDDYLACKEYQGHHVNDKLNNVALFKHSDGQFYFAVYNADGSVRLRSEGFRTGQERDQELSGAIKNLNNESMYSTIRKGDHYMTVLKDKTGREVGRSCLQKDVPVVVPPPVVPAAPVAVAAVAAAVISQVELPKPEPKKVVVETAPPPPVYVAPAVEEVAAAGSGRLLWGLLGAAAIGGAIWWFMNREKPVPQAVVEPLPRIEAPAPTPTPTPAPVAAAPDCSLNWILFDFDKADIRADAKTELSEMAKILKENPSYVGLLSAHTDFKGSDDYNIKLSSRRAENAKSALKAMGIDADRIKTERSGEQRAFTKQIEDDNTRRFNRRVELFIQDKTGKEVCRSIAPEVSADMKAN